MLNNTEPYLLKAIPYMPDFGMPTFSSPVYYPHKHTVQSYRSQQRAARARRRAK